MNYIDTDRPCKLLSRVAGSTANNCVFKCFCWAQLLGTYDNFWTFDCFFFFVTFLRPTPHPVQLYFLGQDGQLALLYLPSLSATTWWLTILAKCWRAASAVKYTFLQMLARNVLFFHLCGTARAVFDAFSAHHWLIFYIFQPTRVLIQRWRVCSPTTRIQFALCTFSRSRYRPV